MTFFLLLITATLQGTVRDANQKPIPAVSVYLEQNGAGNSRTTKTDQHGVYHFASIPFGKYRLRAEGTSQTLTLDSQQTKTLDLSLEPAFFDEPKYTVAGVTDNTYRGGHGADTVLRSSEALTKATAALGKDPAPTNELADSYRRLGDANEHLGKSLDAVHAYQQALDLDATELNTFNLGSELLTHLAPEAAIEVFSKGNRLFPTSTRILLGLAVSLYSRGLYDQAAQRFFEACDLNPANPEPYQFMGKVQRSEITNLDGFAIRLHRFVELQPDNPWANYYFALINPEKAKSLLEKAITLKPDFAEAHLQLGIIAAEQKDSPAAIASFKQAAALDPSLEEPHYRLAQIYKAQNDAQAASQELRLYAEIAKRNAANAERQRSETQRFVIALRNQSQ